MIVIITQTPSCEAAKGISSRPLFQSQSHPKHPSPRSPTPPQTNFLHCNYLQTFPRLALRSSQLSDKNMIQALCMVTDICSSLSNKTYLTQLTRIELSDIITSGCIIQTRPSKIVFRMVEFP